MRTRLLTPADIPAAAALLQAGGVVAMPTETVYGLAADATDPAAVAAIFAAKGRPQDNPLIVHLADGAELPRWVAAVPPAAALLAQLWWPGPLTLVLPRITGDRVSADAVGTGGNRVLADAVSAGLPTVAVRVPAHPVARALIRAAGMPLAAPSANRSGSPSPTTAAHVLDDLGGRIPAVLDGGACAVGLESAVIDLTRDVPRLLRPGAVTPDMLRDALGTLGLSLALDPALAAPLTPGEPAASPGMKYRHYAPRAALTLVRGSSEAYAAHVNAHGGGDAAALCFDGEAAALRVPAIPFGRREDAASQASRLFAALRELDARGVSRAFAPVTPAASDPSGMGLAVYNRLLRAANFHIVIAEEEGASCASSG